MHDAISAERLGIAAVGVITDRFLPTARVMADFVGLSGYPVACIAHPISNNTEEEIRYKAAEVVRQVATIVQDPTRLHAYH